MRLGGKGVASKPTNFPISTIDYILKNYNVNNNYYDFSCGWGVRMLSAMRNNINYFGTDPNYMLVDRLNKLHKDYDEINKTKTNVNIKCQGSEIFIPEWEGTIGVAFSSPPYFSLEDYKIGQQSYKEGMKYEDWTENYLTKTILNIHKYLINNGYLLININNYDKYNLVEDTKKICEENGFIYLESLQLKNIKRIKSTGELGDNSEKIMVFKKMQ